MDFLTGRRRFILFFPPYLLVPFEGKGSEVLLLGDAGVALGFILFAVTAGTEGSETDLRSVPLWIQFWCHAHR